MGVADPNRLAVTGWSYGGILTDYTVASTDRFKAAISGAGVAAPMSFMALTNTFCNMTTSSGRRGRTFSSISS
jgi:dipeptidyl aminopeptidase/acylaminoacyl peptidase